MWTREALHELIQQRLQGYQFIVASNREPYIHRFVGSRIECMEPASGMVAALDPIMRACGGVWVAHGSGDGDRETVDQYGHVRVPPCNPQYMLRRLWLSKEEEQGYYYGLSNGCLWPLCHVSFTRPVFEEQHWETYRQVNKKFAAAILEEAGDNPTFVFLQDYHLALVPRMLKDSNANLIVAQFWHIPWPNPEIFRAFPWLKELLEGLLGNDLLGFHLRHDCQNFIETVDRSIEARTDHVGFEATRRGKTTLVRPFPISIDFNQHGATAQGEGVERETRVWRRRLDLKDDHLLGIGIDRIDYTKGIPERLRAIDRLLEQYPEYRQRLIFVQIGVPSRLGVAAYRGLDQELDALVAHINRKWGTRAWRPVVFVKHHCSEIQMMALHRLARFCFVSSLHDGMNLVAKEFVASRDDEDGVLILSQFTGAAQELGDALLVNPFAIGPGAHAMRQALTMPREERRRRMQKMRSTVAGSNVYRWAGKFLSALLKFDFAESVVSAAASAW
ncbi:MAG: trehalose-6-phosphate synthase [Acidobacteria bacterium]|nr:trehalose-6-phosphate synthase [Acidobacteriota bacterium]